MRKDKAILRILSNPRVIAMHYSPSISRSFTGSMSEARHQAARAIPVPVAVAWPKLLNEWLVVGFVSGILLFLIVNLGLTVRTEAAQLAAKQHMQQAIVKELSYWQGVTKEHPDYRDGYFRQALLQYQLGNEQLAEISLEKSLAIDPNFTAGRTFQEKLAKE